MTSYKWGEILLVNFPQTGTAARKKRPALVILDVGDEDIVLAPITTRKRARADDCTLRDWSAAGLLAQSWVRLAKVACLEKADVIRTLGKLTDYDKTTVANAWQNLYKL